MKQRFAFFGDRNAEGRFMVVIVEKMSNSTHAEIIDANYCTDETKGDYLNKWLGVERPIALIYARGAPH